MTEIYNSYIYKRTNILMEIFQSEWRPHCVKCCTITESKAAPAL